MCQILVSYISIGQLAKEEHTDCLVVWTLANLHMVQSFAGFLSYMCTHAVLHVQVVSSVARISSQEGHTLIHF